MNELMEDAVKEAFTKAGYEEKFARVNVSNRPDYVSISVMERWQLQKLIKKHRL